MLTFDVSLVSSIDASTLLDLLLILVSNLPIASGAQASSLIPLILTRLSSLHSRISLSLSLSTSPTATLHRLYTTTMALAFVRFEVGMKEGEKERVGWKKAVEAGMTAGVEELREEVLRGVCE